MMKKTYLIVRLNLMFSLTLAGFIFFACGDGKKRAEVEVNNRTDSVGINNRGVPLDNIHRSRPKDSLTEKGSKNSGLPLDNLDRARDAK